MQHYEIVLLFNPRDQDCIEETIREYGTKIGMTQGKIHRIEGWGVRTLAYPIQNLKKAYYTLMNVECDKDTIQRLEGDINRNKLIIRYILIRKSTAIVRESSMMRQDQNKKPFREKNRYVKRGR